MCMWALVHAGVHECMRDVCIWKPEDNLSVILRNAVYLL